MIKATQVTVTDTSYPTDPQIDFGATGQVSLVCMATSGPTIYASFNGIDDSVILVPGTQAAAFATRTNTYRKVWFKTASGSPVITASCES